MSWPRRIPINNWVSNLKPPIPKIITLDAYNTLYSTRLPVMEQYCLVGEKYGFKVDPQILTKRFPLVFKELKSLHPNYGKYSGISVNDWWTLLIHDVFHPLIPPTNMIDELLAIFKGSRAYEVLPDVMSFLLAAKSQDLGIIIGIISNADPVIYTLLENIGLSEYFGGYIYLSYDLDVKKPDREIFERALGDIVKKNPELRQITDLKSRCWHIGDERDNDMLAAFDAGWNGVLLDRTDEYKYLSNSIYSNSETNCHQILPESDIVQTSPSTYVASNFNSLKKMLL